MNTMKEHPSSGKSESRGNRAIRQTARILAGILGGSILTRDQVLRSLPFLFYIMFLGLLYISNTYYAERTQLRSYRLQKELKELRYEFVTARSQLMFESKQSEVARRLEASGLHESRVPPVKIMLKKNDR